MKIKKLIEDVASFLHRSAILYEEEEDGGYSLSEPSAEEQALMMDEENQQLLEDMAGMWKRLEERGISKELVLTMMSNAQEPLAVSISSTEITLEATPPCVVKLGPMERAFYIFMLLHPDGLEYKSLTDYQSELLKIYRALAPVGRLDKHKETVARFVDPTTNQASIAASRIKRAFAEAMNAELATQYVIQGPVGGVKKIPLNRSLVHWPDEMMRNALGIKCDTGVQQEAEWVQVARRIFGSK